MLGEIGLNYHFVPEPNDHALQRDVFEYFVRRGVAQNEILNIHSKGAEVDVDCILGDLGGRGRLFAGIRARLNNFTAWPRRACISL